MGEAIKEIQADLDRRYDVGVKLLTCMAQALSVYTKRERDKLPEINIPRCSKEHLGYIVKELTESTEELQRVRRELPRLLENGSGMDCD